MTSLIDSSMILFTNIFVIKQMNKMQGKSVESIKSQYVHQCRLLPALALDLLEATPCLLSLEDN